MRNRWVNQYALRYAVGTVFGAAIVSCLFMQLRAQECTNRYALNLDSWGMIVMLGAAGLAFCYIASAPMHVVHVTRVFRLSRDRNNGHVWLLIGIAAILIIVGTFIRSAISSGASLVAVFGLQLLGIANAFNRRRGLFRFYSRLARRRRSENRPEMGMVGSYRDLREHGNAFAIILLEMLFGAILSGLVHGMATVVYPDYLLPAVLVVLGLWIGPAALVWAIATRLEIDFANTPNAKRTKSEPR